MYGDGKFLGVRAFVLHAVVSLACVDARLWPEPCGAVLFVDIHGSHDSACGSELAPCAGLHEALLSTQIPVNTTCLRVSIGQGTYSGLTNVTAVPNLAGVRQLRLEGNATSVVTLGSVHVHSFSIGPFPLGLAIINITIEELRVFGHAEQGVAVWSLIEITDSVIGRPHGPGLIVSGALYESETSGMVITSSTILGGLSFEPTNHDELGLLVISGSNLSSGNITLGGGGWHVYSTQFLSIDKVTFLNSAQIGDSTTAGRVQFANVNLVEFLGGVRVFGADVMGGGGVVAVGYSEFQDANFDRVHSASAPLDLSKASNQISIVRCNFTNCTGRFAGAALVPHTADIENSAFNENSAHKGGGKLSSSPAIGIIDGEDLQLFTLTGCSFRCNAVDGSPVQLPPLGPAKIGSARMPSTSCYGQGCIYGSSVTPCPGQPLPLDCFQGEISLLGLLPCSRCADGTQVSHIGPIGGICEPCSAGNFSHNGTTCLPCPDGSISSNDKSVNCTSCPADEEPIMGRTACFPVQKRSGFWANLPLWAPILLAGAVLGSVGGFLVVRRRRRSSRVC